MSLLGLSQEEKPIDAVTFMAADANSVTIDLDALHNTNAGPTVVGDNYTIKAQVKENPSTGYIWKISKNDCGARVEMVDSKTERVGDHVKEQQLYGVGMTRTFIFKTPGPDSNHIRGLPCDIEFVNVRPSEHLENTLETSWEQNANVDANVDDKFKRVLTVNVLLECAIGKFRLNLQ